MKPDPGIYAIAEQRCQLVPARTVFIDDLPPNIAAAEARGWRGILHQDESTTRERLLAMATAARALARPQAAARVADEIEALTPARRTGSTA